MDTIGRIVAGRFDKVLIRVKKDKELELGDLITINREQGHSILQVYDLLYRSQISKKVRNLVAGMKLEGYGEELTFTEPELNNYVVASLKNLVDVKQGTPKTPKRLPKFFSELKRSQKQDFSFLTEPSNPLYLGKIRSGSKILPIPVSLPGEQMLRHHTLIPASTGKGKTNTVKILLTSVLENNSFGALVIDPHDEYYGKGQNKGLHHLPDSEENLIYYTPGTPPAGESKLVINISQMVPWDFTGIINLSSAQVEALYAYHQEFKDDDKEKWVENLVLGEEVEGVRQSTLNVLQRKFRVRLNITEQNGALQCNGIFKDQGGATTLRDMRNEVENGNIVVIDTSTLGNKVELLIGSMISQRIFNRYKYYKRKQRLEEKPVVSVVIEEAPRVIGEQRVKEENIFDTIAREGRKFKVGLIAVTQLPSVIPKEILANMNTKIILGTEMGPERKALIESASQDLSKDDRTIASLDIGEAIITSTFTKFAVPTTIPLFEDFVEQKKEGEETHEIQFEGV